MNNKIKTLVVTLITSVCVQAATAGGVTAETDDNAAISALIAEAAQHKQKNELPQASAALERALRLQPRNSSLWARLAELRNLQGQYAQAKAMTAKARQLAQLPSEQKYGPAMSAPVDSISKPPPSSDHASLETELPALADNDAYLSNESNAEVEYGGENYRLDQPQSKNKRHKAVRRDDNYLSDAQLNDYESEMDKTYSRSREEEFDSDRWQYRDGKSNYDRWSDRAAEPRRIAIPNIPRGHYPPPGMCRIWFVNRAIGHQPPPGDCYRLEHVIPANAILLSRSY